jgi:hypothetical protein
MFAGKSPSVFYLLLLIRILGKVNKIHVNLSLAGAQSQALEPLAAAAARKLAGQSCQTPIADGIRKS